MADRKARKRIMGSITGSIWGGLTGRNPRLSRGLALLAVLWILALLALMAATFTRTSRTEVNLARNAMEQLRAESLADAGIYLAAARLQQPVEDGGWSIDGRVRQVHLQDGEIRILIADEAGKIDLNGAGVGLLQALFRALGADRAESAALAEAIADYRDGDHEPLAAGAEDEQYLAADLTHDAKDAPFETVAELQQVLGMTAELYRLAEPALTVHTRRPRPEEDTATPLVVTALRSEASEDGEDGEVGSQDGAATGQATEAGTDTARDGDAADTAFGENGENGGLRSRLALYAIHAEGRSDGGAVFVRDAVVHLVRAPDSTFRTLDWRQGERRLFEDDEDDSQSDPDEN